MSKRKPLKTQREKRHRSEKWILIGIVVFAVILVGLLILPNILPAPTIARPNAVGMAMGDPNAPVKVEQFSDFLCSHCADYAINQEAELIKTYIATGKVYMKFIPTPFLGDSAVLASQAAYCANDQGKFWAYHDILFNNQQNFTISSLISLAGKVNLNTSEFRTCLENKKYEQQVKDDLVYAGTKKVEGTPSFMVNDQVVYRDTLKLTIDLALAYLKK